MKRIISALLALLLLFSLAACSGTGGEGTKKKKLTVCLDWTPNTNHTGFFVAQAKGFYEEAGLDVKIVQPPENGAELMCASGQAQFAVSFQDTIAPSFAMENPLEVTAVAALVQHNTSGIISRKGEGIDRPKGLEGKTYSTWEIPTELATVKAVMEKDGGDYKKLKLIPNVITDEAGALKNGDTDAVWIFYGWSGIAAKQKNFDFDFFDFVSIDKVFDYYTPILIANNSFLEAEGETAKAFLSATKKGFEFAVENPEEAANILVEGDTTGSLVGSEKFVEESQKWVSKQYIADAEDWGVFDAQRWDGFYKWLWDNQLIENEIKPGFGFTNDYLS